jgi:hypothetical protein
MHSGQPNQKIAAGGSCIVALVHVQHGACNESTPNRTQLWRQLDSQLRAVCMWRSCCTLQRRWSLWLESVLSAGKPACSGCGSSGDGLIASWRMHTLVLRLQLGYSIARSSPTCTLPCSLLVASSAFDNTAQKDVMHSAAAYAWLHSPWYCSTRTWS